MKTQSKQGAEMPERKQESGNFGLKFDSSVAIAGWLAIAGIVMLITAFIWEWGYWNAFGISLAVMPLSMESLASSIFSWSPGLAIAILAVTIGCYAGLHHRTNGADAAKIWQLVKDYWGMKMRMRALGVFLEFLVFPKSYILLLIVVTVVHTDMNGGINALLIWTISYCIVWLIASGKYMVIAQIVFLPSLYFVVIYDWARFSAYHDVKDPYMSAHINFVKSDESTLKQFTVLRVGENFIYAYNLDTEQLEIIPWRMVVSVNFDAVPNRLIYNWPSSLDGEDEK